MARKKSQASFFKVPRLEHGGSITAGKRKWARPLDRKRALHVVMRATKARRHLSFRANQAKAQGVWTIIAKQAKKFGVKIEQYGNAGNHIHLLLRFHSRKGFQNFLRSVAGLIARFVTKAQKNNAWGKFWDQLAYSRVVNRGRDFGLTKRYVELNDIEGAGGPMARAIYADKWRRKPWWWRPPKSSV